MAPINNTLVLASVGRNVLGLPRSYKPSEKTKPSDGLRRISSEGSIPFGTRSPMFATRFAIAPATTDGVILHTELPAPVEPHVSRVATVSVKGWWKSRIDGYPAALSTELSSTLFAGRGAGRAGTSWTVEMGDTMAGSFPIAATTAWAKPNHDTAP